MSVTETPCQKCGLEYERRDMTRCPACGAWYCRDCLDENEVCVTCVQMGEIAEVLEEEGIRVLRNTGNRIQTAGGYAITIIDNLLYCGRWSTGSAGRKFEVKASCVKDIYEVTEIIRNGLGMKETA